MSKFLFTNPSTGKQYEVDGPPTMSEAQARKIFDEQLSSGALTGLKSGDTVSSVEQVLSKVPGSVGQFLQQSSSNTNNVGILPSTLTQDTSSVLSRISDLLKSNTPTNPVSIGNVASQLPALTSIQGLSQVDVRVLMSQATNLVNQASNVVSSLGVGKYGFSIDQLERVGVVKPGTNTLMTTTQSDITTILSSPSVFTGKFNVNSLSDILNNISIQDLLQQNLISQGLSGLQELGISVDKFNIGALAGTALNAAKSIPNTYEWIMGNGIGASLKTQFDQTARSADYATTFASTKLNDAVAQEEEPGTAENTVNRDTIDAAVSRITGNSKIPVVSYSSSTKTADVSSLARSINSFVSDYNQLYTETILPLLKNNVNVLDVTQLVNGLELREQALSDLLDFKSQGLSIERKVDSYTENGGSSISEFSKLDLSNKEIASTIGVLENIIDKFKFRIQTAIL